MGKIFGDLFGMKSPEPPPPPPMPDPDAIAREAAEKARKRAQSRYGRNKTILTGDVELGEPSTKSPTLIGG